jgi:hypothetical protein
MNKEDIIRMAQEAQMPFYWRTGEITYLDKLEAFAALVASHALVEPCCGNYDQCQKVCMPRAASAEREACAKHLDALGCDHCATAIRARGETK